MYQKKLAFAVGEFYIAPDPEAVHGGGDGFDGREVVGARAGQPSLEASDGGPQGIDDHGVPHLLSPE